MGAFVFMRFHVGNLDLQWIVPVATSNIQHSGEPAFISIHLHTSSFQSSYIFNILRTCSHTNHHHFTEPQPSRHAASMWLIGLDSIKLLLWDTLGCELQLQPFASSSVAMVSHGDSIRIRYWKFQFCQSQPPYWGFISPCNLLVC